MNYTPVETRRADTYFRLFTIGKPLASEPSGVVWQPVLLLRVAPSARRHDVVPRVRPAERTRDDVIDVLRRASAVLAHPVVAGEHRPPR